MPKIQLTVGLALVVAIMSPTIAPSQTKPTVEQRLAALERKLSTVEAENSRLRDYNEIQQLQALYAHYINLNASQKIVELFADSPDVEIEISNKGRLIGRTAPVRWRFGDETNPDRSEKPRPAGQMSMHVSDNPVLQIDARGEHARAVWLSPGISTLRLARDNGTKVTAMWNWGKYEMEYIKQGGKWKILKLRYHQIFLTPYDKGWTVESLDPDTTRERVKPDQPSAPDFYDPYHVDRSNSFAPLPPEPYPGG